MKILVTGATGYIGSVLVRRAQAAGHTIVAASRRPAQHGYAWLPYRLGDELVVPGDVQVIIHLAADTTGSLNDPDAELSAVVALMGKSGEDKLPFIFVSSQTSRVDAPTAYGRTKWMIEQYVLKRGGWVIRPGQVYGGPELGLFGTLTSLLRHIPVLPAFFPAPLIQPIHVEDCAEGLLRVAVRQPVDLRIIHLACTEPVAFTDFLRSIARNRLRKRVLFIPFPTMLLRGLIRASGRLGISLPVLDKISSLLEVPQVASSNDLCELGLQLRSLTDGMLKAGDGRRRLLEEGHALISYVLRRSPSRQQLSSYVRSVELLSQGRPLKLPRWMVKMPALVALIDSPQILRDHDALRWRIDAATVISEASPVGFVRYMRAGRSRAKMTALLALMYAVLAEAVWRVVRLIASPWVTRLIGSLRETSHV